MLIQNYGLFWKVNQIDWYPGNGARGAFRLLGRRGSQAANLELADFRKQKGIYILYGNRGPHYVGLCRKQGLGTRLKQHLSDKHEDKWDRFSWFGFCALLRSRDKATGLLPLKELPQVQLGAPTKAIADLEALLIKAMGLSNVADMKFQTALEWLQVDEDETEKFLERARER